ncbi:RINGv [Musa troglodytarum]|uniref:RINGv n=1 Tax=Musa troglodytarum TaxID=320322 RepID=A0A9E7EB12_9LILI|nr:RINGv [Musa troglodytarum]URD73625.1 RINGv [Musa troglodytarum]URD73626.1 RINGv [Musa troglodytarum]
MAKGGKSFQDTEGRPQRSRPMNESDEDSNCFTDAEDEAWHSPCNSSFTCSASDMLRFSGASHCEIDGSPEACSKSYVSDRSRQGDLESGIWEIKKGDKDCRICHLNLEEDAPESGVQILLGCSCKNDLGIAHKLCAEKWFKTKGNKTCEICGSTAQNVVVSDEAELIEQSDEADTTSGPRTQATETQGFWQGHRFLNFLLACVVFAFVVSWLFHFNIPG